ncbi:MAG: hypothetical protein ABJZ55_15975 [Fuerstiella sp.]
MGSSEGAALVTLGGSDGSITVGDLVWDGLVWDDLVRDGFLLWQHPQGFRTSMLTWSTSVAG